MTQTELATWLGISGQQVGRYEGGINRIAATRLAHIAAGLGLPVTLLLTG